MKQSILRFGLWTVCSLLLPLAVEGQQLRRPQQQLFQGLSLNADLFGYVGQVFGNEYTSCEVAGEVNLKNTFFPIVEVGYGTVDYTDEEKDVHYQVGAPYFRVGVNYNFYHKKDTPNYLYGGVRVGYSSFSYDIDAPDLTDPVWGGTVPFAYQDVACTATWIEFVVGLRTQISNSVHMGWSLRYKRRVSVTEHDFAEAWYVPGFGTNSSALFGATYNIIYHLPW